ncbi:cell division protein FtsZ [Rhodobacteraceae bacterium 2376]|uniref:Cell division protein FtsZ n=1 Tax=Rhabdonatronobacter sediminivivens TaxID=2743469 RepID=A0A7Z0KWU9_9RHOB|nr:cell division protein FtsZ [Rhabdonatronobacter sediminivivens]NYS24382.1 cell division protein FtsZ [Rhabdonatronobacter sediminivivens]
MTLTFIENQQQDLAPRITVFGVGGAGGNAVNNMIDKNLEGVDFVVANTDAQALQQSRARSRVQMGVKVTEGLGAGARAAVGAAAAEETIEEIVDHLAGAHMCFITAGMGGGTGTGAAPIIAQAARELGVLTVGVVTKPFQFEGNKRMRQAEEGVEALQKVVDTLIIIPNQNLFRLANEKTTFTEAFALADDVLYQGVKGVTDLMVRPGLINLDFADVRAVMDEMGKAMMGTGEATGEDRAVQAAEKAIANPLLDEISLHGARGVLINITGGHDLTLFELDEAANRIREKVDPEANIIVGSTLDAEMEGAIRVSVVATGIDASVSAQEVDVPRRRMAEPLRQPAVEAPMPEPQPEPEVEIEEPVFVPRSEEGAEHDPQPNLFAEPHDAERPAARSYSRSPEPQHQPATPPLKFRQEAESRPAPEHDARDFDIDEVLDETPRVASGGGRGGYGDSADRFVAPRRNGGPGAPSPETLARLQAAVSKAPAARREDPQPQQPAPESDRASGGRFGIGSLISRMAGQGEPPQPRGPRSQPPVSGHEEDRGHSADQERIEIPAFLRRQAN